MPLITNLAILENLLLSTRINVANPASPIIKNCYVVSGSSEAENTKASFVVGQSAETQDAH